LMAWRIKTRAAFQGRPEAEVLADVERAREVLAAAPQVTIGSEQVADLRGQQIPELPEAAARDGQAFVARITDRDGRVKVVLQGASAETLRAFLDQPPFGLIDVYGDPARGFAGGYES